MKNHVPGVVLASLLVVAACDGCGGGRVKVAGDFSGIEEGQRVSVDGVLSLRGSTPFASLVLETGDETVLTIDSRDDALMTELRGLLEMRVTLDGTMLAPLVPGSPRIDATGYQLLPLPTGEVPIVGILALEDNQCVLVAKDGKRYWIRGDLTGAIREYEGARIWIVGARADTDAPGRPKKSTPFTPTGYGVLDEAPAP
ncbi:MAG: hypothetical protein OEX18_04700 [Candidatus Krumholzibacteria bacterium]|nr:hypothetical protein [Candidatus Krumholzibacteria bacterium]MDH4336559.1 hypothetical protein [Candidatus Krumholzibacteria bacterium]MDH5269640.1 hypothetical protein [Candidatus Krumholzibacteria bacterium]